MPDNVKQERPDLGNSIENSEERVDKILDEWDTVVLAFSGGKDSGAVLNMFVDRIRARGGWDGRFHITHNDDEFVLPETERFAKEVATWDEIDKFWWICMPIKYTNYSSIEQRFFYPWHPEKEDRWIRDYPYEVEEIDSIELVGMDHPLMETWEVGDKHVHVAQMVKEEIGGNCFNATGVRSDESRTRVRAINNLGGWYSKSETKAGFEYHTGHPIYDMTDHDLWKIHRERDWDYNESYDKQIRMGYPITRLRTAHCFLNAAVNFNIHPVMRRYWPDMLEKAEQRFDGCPMTFKHGGDLFSVQKDDDQTWEQRTYELLSIMDEETDKVDSVINHIQNSIDTHYERASIPMPDAASCSYCHASWHGFAASVNRELFNLEGN